MSFVFLVREVAIGASDNADDLVFETLFINRCFFIPNPSKRMVYVIFIHYLDQFRLCIVVFVFEVVFLDFGFANDMVLHKVIVLLLFVHHVYVFYFPIVINGFSLRFDVIM